MKIFLFSFLVLLGAGLGLLAQAPPDSGSSGGGDNAKSDGVTSMFGKEVPIFDPGTETVQVGGKNLNIRNNPIFTGRFEKYLNAPEQTSGEDLAYQAIVKSIMDRLEGKNFKDKLDATGFLNKKMQDSKGKSQIVQAWLLLSDAADYAQDGNQCKSLADAVYSVWLSKENQKTLTAANEDLEVERRRQEREIEFAAGKSSIASGSKDPKVSAQNTESSAVSKALSMKPATERLAQVNARMALNSAKQTLSELQSKVEYQAIIAQMFIQRRYQHVLMATRFYRHIFGDGDTKFQAPDSARESFMKALDVVDAPMPTTLGQLDTMAREAIRDVDEGVNAYKYLVEKKELDSASKRLGEIFIIGEYLPPIRTLPRELKRQALDYSHKVNKLISAIDVKDFGLAETLVKEMSEVAKDFDSSKPMAAIETAKTIATMHIAKARNAAVSGDKVTLEKELRAATEVWPRNPMLKEASEKIFTQGDTQQMAIADFEQLLSQHNYRRIFDDKVRFIAATALYPEKQGKLKKVLDDMQVIEGSIIRCKEMARSGNYMGAWENAERTVKEFPDDTELNKIRADLTSQAAELVRTLKMAQQLEEKEQTGSSLAWYLKAQKIYPPSDFAREGIDRLVKKIMPATT